MYCENCGTKLEEGGRYCWKCGALIEDEETAGLSEEKKKSRWDPMNILLIVLLVLLGAVFCIRQFPGKGKDLSFRGGPSMEQYISAPEK